jgi:hypothetical protein
MDMSFQEKSAWGSLIILALVSYWFYPTALEIAGDGSKPADLYVLMIGCVVVLIIFEVIYHTIIAVAGGTDRDERDRLFVMRAERNAMFVLWTGLFWIVGHILISAATEEVASLGKLEIAVWILFALSASEFAKLASQVWYYRVSV